MAPCPLSVLTTFVMEGFILFVCLRQSQELQIVSVFLQGVIAMNTHRGVASFITTTAGIVVFTQPFSSFETVENWPLWLYELLRASVLGLQVRVPVNPSLLYQWPDWKGWCLAGLPDRHTRMLSYSCYFCVSLTEWIFFLTVMGRIAIGRPHWCQVHHHAPCAPDTKFILVILIACVRWAVALHGEKQILK